MPVSSSAILHCNTQFKEKGALYEWIKTLTLEAQFRQTLRFKAFKRIFIAFIRTTKPQSIIQNVLTQRHICVSNSLLCR